MRLTITLSLSLIVSMSSGAFADDTSSAPPAQLEKVTPAEPVKSSGESATEKPQTNDRQWIKSYKGQIFDQALSPRFQEFLERELPAKWPDLGFTKKGSKPSIRDTTEAVFGGPTEPMTGRDDRAYFWACQAHACANKGFLWIDARAKKSVAAIVHYALDGKTFKNPQVLVATKSASCTSLPKGAARDIKIWLKNVKVKPETTRCLNASGSVKTFKL